jgi:hypothetical protein
MMRIVAILIILTLHLHTFGQKIGDLQSYLLEVNEESFGVQMANSTLRFSEANYALFKSQLKPQLSFNSTLPMYTRTSTSITQPNGSIAFQPLYQHLASFTLFVEQPILPTGGTLFVESGFDRFDDLSRNFTLFNGIPFRIGYRQSLIGFNQWKWAKTIEHQRLFTAKKQYTYEVADLQFQAVNTYFDALITQNNFTIAETNKNVNEKLLLIAEERLNFGKISKDEKLQMESEYKQAIMLYAQTLNSVKQAKLNLQTILNKNVEINEVLITPEIFNIQLPSEQTLIEMALDNAPNIPMNKVAIASQKRDASRIKAEMSPTFQVFSTIGLAQSGERAAEVYQRPFNEQQIQASINIPILDWGRRKSAIRASEEQINLLELEGERIKKNLVNLIKLRYIDIQEMQSRLFLQKELIDISEERYKISKERYSAGAILITELVFAQRNKDQALRDYLLSLRDYYLAYYDLKRWTGI